MEFQLGRVQDASAKRTRSCNRGLQKGEFLPHLVGNIGIGHVRYPTAGSDDVSEAQPFHAANPETSLLPITVR